MSIPPANHRQTYCNPLPLPNYPRGMVTYKPRTPDFDGGWRRSEKLHFRETADPTVLFYEGKWYLYPSCGSAYVSSDFITWEQHRIDPYNPGYAPTIVLHRGKFYLTTCDSIIYESESPLGPFRTIGSPKKPNGELLYWVDPMLFSDDDGRLYAYWGLGKPGIFGAELNPTDPTQLITEPQLLFAFNPNHPWERFGDWNEDASVNYNEGSWMLRLGDTYYLTYATPGTQWRTYCMAAYVAKSPLGPFVPQKKNPFLQTKEGLIQGPGHGCVVAGPRGTLWAFYTCTVGVNHIFERRIGMDPVALDSEGNLVSLGASQIPQWAPGLLPQPASGNSANLIPLSMNKKALASSEAPGREAMYAVDNSMKTWWEPQDSDAQPSLTIFLESNFSIAALRLIWRDEGLDYDADILPGPFAYIVEAKVNNTWQTILDKRNNQIDMLIDYLTFNPAIADCVRISLFDWPKGIRPALTDITVFGIIS